MAVTETVDKHVQWPEFSGARILIVDDDSDSLFLLARSLRKAGCTDLLLTGDPIEALSLAESEQPDIVVMDLNLPGSHGLRLMDLMHDRLPAYDELPVLMVTSDCSESVKRQALRHGVADFLAKNSDTTEFVLRVRNLLRLRGMKRTIREHQESLEAIVKLRTLELESARREVLERLARAAEYRDDATGEHTRRVGRLSSQIAGQLSVPKQFVEAIGNAALLHDLGKIAIPDRILKKPGKLTVAEFEQIKTHPEIGASILDGCDEPVLKMSREIALTHHERWDGNGYPQGLSREAIPLSGRIVAVADAFDAMTHERPYKTALPIPMAVTMIAAERGFHFDPHVVDAFLAVVHSEPIDEP